MEKARQEYCEYIYDRIVQKLSQAEEWELLSFALLGIHLRLRQSDALRLKWDQVDFVNCKLNNVVLIKGDRQIAVHSYNMDKELTNILTNWHSNTNDTINMFPNLKRYMSGKRIGDLIGDTRFGSSNLRSIGNCLKFFMIAETK